MMLLLRSRLVDMSPLPKSSSERERNSGGIRFFGQHLGLLVTGRSNVDRIKCICQSIVAILASFGKLEKSLPMLRIASFSLLN